jgi:hypothetical protein
LEQAGIQPAMSQQLFVGAILCKLSINQHENPVNV